MDGHFPCSLKLAIPALQPLCFEACEHILLHPVRASQYTECTVRTFTDLISFSRSQNLFQMPGQIWSEVEAPRKSLLSKVTLDVKARLPRTWAYCCRDDLQHDRIFFALASAAAAFRYPFTATSLAFQTLAPI